METPETLPLLLGAHMSIAGGVSSAVQRAVSIGCTTFQMFVKNNNRWKGAPLADKDVATYKELMLKARISPVLVHDGYLINLCARDKATLKRSREALTDEFTRCAVLGVEYLNLHPGSHVGAGELEGIKHIAESINVVHEKTRGTSVKSVLETAAGQGTAVGYRFEQLRAIIDLVDEQARMAVCVDTCHVFAAGYDIATERGYEETFREFDQVIGLGRLVAFHVNDSKRELGSRVDRHEHIGKGEIGRHGFAMLMNDPRLVRIPKILETPKGPDMKEDRENMAFLRGLVRGRPVG